MIIYVYNGEGCSTFSAQNLKFSLSMALQRFGGDVRFMNEHDIIDGSILSPESTKMIVMGGGRFTPTKAALGEKGLENIKQYVHDGGQYMGICMGSYAAFQNIDFWGQERSKSQAMGFFNITARGGRLPVTAPFDGTPNSAAIIEIQHLRHNEKFPTLYWGGNGMDEQELLDIGATPLAKLTLPDGVQKIMSAQTHVGDYGGKATLCAYHPEGYSRDVIWKWLQGLSPNDPCYKMLAPELLAHPDKAYLMGLACALDDAALIPDHSFVAQVKSGWQNLSDALKSQETRQISALDQSAMISHWFN